ncbi:TRI15 transcription factor [Fusarium mundagurra]|uniref:TRI15 transcription factor n=1 Tax=Fusarium mundagurra TaxID=1567541 RepID=A0A8H5YDQ1_9HYPO|nr:TRI15 transcription factor [Fusarium mundagurra]
MADASVVDNDQQQLLKVAQTPSFCRLCNIELRGLETWKAHVKSDGQQKREEFEDYDPESESDAEEDDFEEDQELVVTEFVPSHCLFCTKDTSTLDDSMKHMSSAHSFNIPFQEFLAVDLETLISYLHFVINTYRECICCGTRRSTVEGIQHHMLAKGHCRFDISPETEEFYEIPQYEDALGDRKQDSSDSVRLPSGRIISHRKHEESRVPRRDVADQKRLDSSAPVEPGMEIAHRRTVNGSREVVQANEAILAAQLSRLKVTSDRAAQREEKRWRGRSPHARLTLRALIKMSSSRSSSPVSSEDPFSAIPNSPVYAPEMDSQGKAQNLKGDDIDELWQVQWYLEYLKFPSDGIGEYLFHFLGFCTVPNFTNYAKMLIILIASTDIWFTLPLVDLGEGEEEDFSHPEQDISAVLFDTSTNGKVFGDMGLFYLSINLETAQMRVLFTQAVPVTEKLIASCRRAADFGIRDDAFTLLTCALSAVLELQSENAYFLSSSLTKSEEYGNSLQFEITEDEETKVKKTAILLRKCLPYMEKMSEVVECIIQVIGDTLNEHRECRKHISIPRQHFRRVEKNLQTLRSKAISFKTYQETRIRRINLSTLLSLRADSAIKASTEAMTRLTEANREDSGRMNDIAIATKLDSEAMITIAKLTMLYLPPTFIATLFSMGIFNFDFDNGKNGRLVVSSQWWMYFVVTIPFTLGTFYGFRAVTRSHKQASQKAEREARQPE